MPSKWLIVTVVVWLVLGLTLNFVIRAALY
jgi:hypothetical protein